jgi:hypothetical protein
MAKRLIPVLIVAFFVAAVSPPAQAELGTITLILVTVFSASVFVSEVFTSKKEKTKDQPQITEIDCNGNRF